MQRILLILSLFFLVSFAADQRGYELYTGKGKITTYAKMIKALQDADVILFGELHNNAISHWLQLKIGKSFLDKEPVFGAEMYEADNQIILDEYLSGIITEKNFTEQMRLWKNNETDYQPLVNLAKENNRPFIATNVPRRYASLVYREGLEGLDSVSEEAKAWIAPLPIEVNMELKAYKEMLDMGMGHSGENIVKSQALKDATMAYFIGQNLSKGKVFIHFEGTYHSDNYESIYYYLKKDHPDLVIRTISTVEQEVVGSLEPEHEGKADFILVVDKDMTPTY
jgi:uncharacterized iron-regulated protein